MVLNVVQVGNEVLRKVCSPITKFDDKLAKLLDDMKDTVRDEHGAGLAAPQIGVDKRCVVVDVDEGFFEFVNPVILSKSGSYTSLEGCLSVRGQWGYVERPTKVKIEYRDRKGKKHTLTAYDFFAKCICHELDHLDGVLYTDKAERMLTPEEVKKLEEQNK